MNGNLYRLFLNRVLNVSVAVVPVPSSKVQCQAGLGTAGMGPVAAWAERGDARAAAVKATPAANTVRDLCLVLRINAETCVDTQSSFA